MFACIHFNVDRYPYPIFKILNYIFRQLKMSLHVSDAFTVTKAEGHQNKSDDVEMKRLLKIIWERVVIQKVRRPWKQLLEL